MRRFFVVLLMMLLVLSVGCTTNDNGELNGTDQNGMEANGDNNQDPNDNGDDQTLETTNERGLFGGEDLPLLPVIADGMFHRVGFREGCVSLIEGVDFRFSDCDGYGYMVFGYTLDQVYDLYFEAVEADIIATETGHPNFSVIVFETGDEERPIAQISLELSDETITIAVWFYYSE
jgi:hypothetical protein